MDLYLPSHAEAYARIWHRDQTYSGGDYTDNHLRLVVNSLIDDGQNDDVMLSAAWLHDGPEDAPNAAVRTARQTLIDAEFGTETGGLVFAVTGIGANRKERNANAYAKIPVVPRAAILKGHDRFINALTSQHEMPDLHKMYRKEYPGFRELVAGSISRMLLDALDRAHEPA
jgi:(p)ppGpp synthase/HD superfamily hydrolase